MRRDEQWDNNYMQIMQFMQERKCRPAKRHVEDRQMVNWIKFNKKQMKRGKMPAHRIERFQQLLEEATRWQRLNQYAYINNDSTQTTLDL